MASSDINMTGWFPNEQLLLRAVVLYKKKQGTLFVTPRRVTYQQQGVTQLALSIFYKDIEGLAQTLEGAEKVLLKISVKEPPTKSYTFQFTSLKNLQEREAIKAQVAELLARTRGTSSSSSVVGTPAPMTPQSTVASPSPSTPQSTNNISSPVTLQQQAVVNTMAKPVPGSPAPPGTPTNSRQEEFNDRVHLIRTSRELQTLHKELVVVDKSVTEEDFWASSYVKRIRQKLKKDAVSREGKQKGKSSRMVELKPGQQEGSDIKYTLTSQIIHNIFTEFPSVKRAYDTNVPDKMNEQKFWIRFLASEFFHRSRTGTKTRLAPYDDIFDRCLQEEDDENSKPPPMTRMDKIRFDIDLSSTAEDHLESGNAPDFTMKPGREAQSLPLIRRFNKHSSRVLETPASGTKRKELTLKQEIEKNIIISDLMDEAPSEKIILDIQDTRRYFESQTAAQNTVKINEEDTKRLLSGYKRKFEGWQPEMARMVLMTGSADKVCAELTVTIKKKMRHNDKSVADMKLPPVVQQQIQSYHSATNEILRHFWSSFEPQYRRDKNLRMIEALKKQKGKKKEILTIVANQNGDQRGCELTLEPVLRAVEKALAVAKSKEETDQKDQKRSGARK